MDEQRLSQIRAEIAEEARRREQQEGYPADYLAAVDDAIARRRAGPGVSNEVRDYLAIMQEHAHVDIDVPTSSLRPPVRVVKRGVKLLVGWYIRFIAQQVASFFQLMAASLQAVADRFDHHEQVDAQLTARVTDLEERVRRLERAGADGGEAS